MASDELLQLRDCCVTFGEKIVLSGITLALSRNDFFILTGPNGGGKTTILRLMAGLLTPTSGKIIRTAVLTGYLPQYRHIDRQFPITVEQTVLSGLNNRKSIWQPFKTKHREMAEKAMDMMQIGGLAKKPIDSLSGGQWQKTLIARALASSPDILLLDEPETHLDIESKRHLYSVLENLRSSMAIVLVSHESGIVNEISNKRIYKVEQTLTPVDETE